MTVCYMATAENIVTVETEKRNGSDPVKQKPLVPAGVALRKGFSVILGLRLAPLPESYQGVPTAMR